MLRCSSSLSCTLCTATSLDTLILNNHYLKPAHFLSFWGSPVSGYAENEYHAAHDRFTFLPKFCVRHGKPVGQGHFQCSNHWRWSSIHSTRQSARQWKTCFLQCAGAWQEPRIHRFFTPTIDQLQAELPKFGQCDVFSWDSDSEWQHTCRV